MFIFFNSFGRRLFLVAFSIVLPVSYWIFFIPSDYYVIPVQIDTYWNLPLIQIEITNKKHKVALDLGARFSVFSSNDLNEIDKKFFRTFFHYNVRGNGYLSSIYEVSGVKIHNLFLSKMKVLEESEEFMASSVFDGDIKRRSHIGFLGRDVFEGKNFLLDFPQSKIILCKNFQDLPRNFYKLEDFIKVPFSFDRRMGICFQVETDDGMKHLLLDTGASGSLLCPPTEEAMLSEEISHGFSVWRSKKLVFGDHDFGEAKFHLFKLPPCWDKIDGALGMDFLKERAIYLDTEQSVAYIAKSTKPATLFK